MAESLSAPWVPVAVSAIEMAFPASVRHLMPAEADIPEDFWQRQGNEWERIASLWSSRGLPATVEFHMRDGINGVTMYGHLRCILGSFEPKHEYKIAAVAFLLSVWCERVEGWEHDG